MQVNISKDELEIIRTALEYQIGDLKAVDEFEQAEPFEKVLEDIKKL